MNSVPIDLAQFERDFRDGLITPYEAKRNSIDKELRKMINTRGPIEESEGRITEDEAKKYIAHRGIPAINHLLLLQTKNELNIFSEKAFAYLNTKFIERVETLNPELRVLTRSLEYFMLRYGQNYFSFHIDWQGSHIDLRTGYDHSVSEVYKIQFFHDLLIDKSGVNLTIGDEEIQNSLPPTLHQIEVLRDLIPELHRQGYAMEPELRVFQQTDRQIRADAFRYRRGDEEPNYFTVDEEGNPVPADIQVVILTISTETGEILAEHSGQLPR